MSSDKQFTSPIAEDVIRNFLLGRLDAAAQKKFEEQLMADDGLHERVRQAEFQLADDFVEEEIDGLDRQRFVKSFMLTDERARMVTVSEALRRRFAPATAVRKPSGLRARWPRLAFLNQPAFRFAFGVLVLLLLVASLWLVTREPELVKRFIPRRGRPAKPAAVATPEYSNHPVDSAPPAHQESPPSPSSHESSPPSQTDNPQIVTTVTPANTVDQAPTVSLSPAVTGVVRLELPIEQDEASGFKAELFTASQSIFVVDSLKAGTNARLALDVPVEVLKAGDYEIRLSRLNDQSKPVIANFYFRVFGVR